MSLVVDASQHDLRFANTKLKELLAQNPVTLRNVIHLHGVAAGLKSGEVIIAGDSGDYLGALNDGATIRVEGNAGKYLADNMTRGVVIVEGDAEYGAGPYCYGGTIVVRGSAGDFTAVMNKGATIIIVGDVGDDVATYMLAGDLIILGNAGTNLGNYLIRGNIYIRGEWASLGNNTLLEEMKPDDVAKLRDHFETYSLDADPTDFKKIVRLSEKPFYKSKTEDRVERVVETLSLAR
jgi:glutamate synthase domain-containing protein 3